MAGGGITPANARRIVDATGCTELHLSARSFVESKMKYRNPCCPLGVNPTSDYTWKTTDESVVDRVVALFRPEAKPTSSQRRRHKKIAKDAKK
jgi:copper homeostasis protein